MNKDDVIEVALQAFDRRHHEFEIFMTGIERWFATHPKLAKAKPPIVHSVKSRLKDREHLREKLNRKWKDTAPIDESNVFDRINDLAGVRVLHLHQAQFSLIHEEVLNKVAAKDWILHEPPKAYTWDPESQNFFQSLDISVELKESFYTSVHYLLRPRFDSPLCCELQVRTLFEEIWGEVDHSMNYPQPSRVLSCVEQLRVLAKVVGAGSRLVDSIFRVSGEPKP